MDGGGPLARLGLGPTATLDDVRAARRRLAKEHHPDHGGDPTEMQAVNAAFDAAVKALLRPEAVAGAAPAPGEPQPTAPEPPPSPGESPPPGRRGRVEHDVPSFTIDVLPAEAFEALLVVTAWHGDVLVDDAPYVLEVHLHDPAPSWCRLELLPEAGGTIVNLSVVALLGEHPSAEEVRDLLVDSLNRLGD